MQGAKFRKYSLKRSSSKKKKGPNSNKAGKESSQKSYDNSPILYLGQKESYRIGEHTGKSRKNVVSQNTKRARAKSRSGSFLSESIVGST